MYNLLVGGAAGDGIETMAGVFEKILKRKAFYLFSMRDFMSRVRGGHNFAQIRFGPQPVAAHRDTLDGLVAFNRESFELHRHQLSEEAFVLCDQSFGVEDPHAIPVDLYGIAKRAGNPKTLGTVCIGALLKLFGLGMAGAEEVLRETLKPAILEANLLALQGGYDAVPGRFSIPVGRAQGNLLLTGAEAMGLGALAGGVRFYSAYPMSPSTTLLDFFSLHHADFRVAVEQAEDEIAAVNMALGAAATGARAMAGTSGGGFSLMVEALGFAGIAEIPVVLVDVMRPGPATGLPTRTEQSDLSFVISASQGEFPRMVIAVRGPEDAFYQTARAFRLAEQYQIPVILLSDQYIADSALTIPMLDAARARGMARLPEEFSGMQGEDAAYQRYALTESGISPLRYPGQSGAVVKWDSDEHTQDGRITEAADVRVSMVDKRARKLAGLAAEVQEPDYVGHETPEMLLVGFGSTLPILAEAVDLLHQSGIGRVGALVFGDVYPLPLGKLTAMTRKAKWIVNVEQNATGQLARLIRQESGIVCDASILKYDGRQISVDEIYDRTTQLLAQGGLR